ncbi:hypothetical protein Dalk_1021 [Desulfatibacillum aliphaticivorans]|uniref:Uncharacterized protein n=1 Tax=Desulfatibacillum aliphaticivorans TaxID=218208 RepID=B8FK49_DESAL|nr:hypothetical protein [Desulfatibacillum aliphaticivorans]ACL02724.1 hypothetical protein Dalk_1021 [Desulfatibacillum aliphaticivorans]
MRLPINLDFFIKAHAWKLFLLTGAPSLAGVLLLFALFNQVPQALDAWPAWIVSIAAFLLSVLCAGLLTLGNGVMIAWMYALGVRLHEVESDRAMNFKKRLKILCLVDIILIALWTMLLANKILFFNMTFCTLLLNLEYLLRIVITYLVSKEFIFFEREGRGVFIETMGVFFHIYIFPYGIWFFQPRMQALMKKLDQAADLPEKAV